MLDYWGYNTMKYFPWGHTNVQNVSINNSYLDAFVNYPEDSSARQIYFKDYGGFNAHYWGHQTDIYNITGDTGAHVVSLNLGYNTQIGDITLGIDAYLSDIYTYDNDNNSNALQNIVIGDNAAIDGDWDSIYMYYNSYMQDLILDSNSGISNINLYNGANIRNVKLSNDAFIGDIAIDDYGAFRQVEVGISSYIDTMNMGVSSCFKRVKLGIDSYIAYCSIGLNGYFKHIEMGDASQMNCIVVGDYSYFQYVNLGISSAINGVNQSYGHSNFEYINVEVDSNISSIALGPYCSFDHITIGSDTTIDNIDASTATYASVRDIDIKNNSYFGGLDMASGSYVRNIDVATNCEVGSWDLSI
jgi:hypothetical protein